MKEYWDREIEKFDASYEHADGRLTRFINIFRSNAIKKRMSVARELAERLPESSVILDVGCGSGRLCVELARRGYLLYGYDISEKSIELARYRARKEEVDVHFEVSDITKRHFSKYDLAICLGVVDYLSDREFSKLLKNLFKSGDKLVLSFPVPKVKSYVRFIYRRATGIKIYPRSERDMRSILESHGFENLKFIDKDLGASMIVHNCRR